MCGGDYFHSTVSRGDFDNMPNSERSVVVTGASTGIGEATALLLARQGFRVFAAVRRCEDGEKLKAQNGAIETLLMDVTDTAAVSRAAADVAAVTGGQLYGLVNNAGIAVAGPLECLPIAELERQLDINVIGPVRVTQAFLPMLRAAQGRIVMMSSVAGKSAMPVVGAYSASKFALEALSDTWRVELYNWNIKVILVEPGPIQTPIWDKSAILATGAMEGVAPEKLALYSKLIEVGSRFARKAGQSGLPAEAVAGVVLKALTKSRPKARYMIGKGSTERMLLEAMPTGLRDWILAKAI